MFKLYWLAVLVGVSLVLQSESQQASIYSSGCNYTEVDLTWFCDAQQLYYNTSLQEIVPINYTDFIGTGYEVIHLWLDNFHGYIPNNTFVSFGARSYVYSQSLDANGVATDKEPEPTLTFNCDYTYQGFIGWSEESFTGLEFIRHLVFKNCYFYQYPEGGMTPFNNLYSFIVDGGIIHNVITYQDGFKGINVEKKDGIPGSGLVYIAAPAPPPYYWYPPNLLAPFENATKLVLKDQEALRLFASNLTPLKRLQFLEFSGQRTFYLPTTLFDTSPALGTVYMYNVDWFCYCNGLWWETKLSELGINWKADQICQSPNSQQGKTINRYSAESGCVPPAGFDNSRIPKILMAIASILLTIISSLAWLPIMPLWEKVLVRSIVVEWADVPEDAEPGEAEDPNTEMKIEVRTEDDRDKDAMERKVREQLRAVHKEGQGLGDIVVSANENAAEQNQV